VKRRLPAQAGAFYPDTEGALRTQIQQSFLHPLGPRSIPTIPGTRNPNLLGLIVPHAGYKYSGPVAAHSYHQLASAGIMESIIILGPNHTGLGSGVSTMTEGVWSTPLGDVPIDTNLAREIVDSSNLVDVEDEAHRNEHSIEVQLPFLQFIYPRRFKFVPICMMLQDLKTSMEVGEAIAKVAEKHGAAVIASSDWTHYEPQEEARSKDKQAIEAALQMDEKKFQKIIEERVISACGYGPVTAMIHAAKLRGARNGKLLSYQTSGDTGGDKSAVVGYAAASFEK
jgi:MEMO1 family protein